MANILRGKGVWNIIRKKGKDETVGERIGNIRRGRENLLRGNKL